MDSSSQSTSWAGAFQNLAKSSDPKKTGEETVPLPSNISPIFLVAKDVIRIRISEMGLSKYVLKSLSLWFQLRISMWPE